eukprot:GEMP01003265.1.p1 GENE.GEMP01003265.1~~GEMP01003265.1.p1  ORF type:complete len:954 (+),score=177.23 GEMP01003265.1:144-2864(+)
MMNRDRVKVAVRCRPLLENEERRECVRIKDNTCSLGSHNSHHNAPDTRFTYDICFERDATQEDVFEALGSHVMNNTMDGYNATLFAYGQTGSGKTHSLHGSVDNPGVLPRMIDQLFNAIERESTVSFVVKVSYLEIYNERVRDLLAVSDNKALDIKQLADNSIIIPNLSECTVYSGNDAVRLMHFGNTKRMQGSTSMNECSSRSHSIFTLDVTQSDESRQMEKRSKLNIVDLAGSERQSKAQSSGERLREGCLINQSLTYLSCCINALVNGDGYVPFRNSKLTHFLSDCLAGNSKTAMLATISPASMNFEETMSTLRFATKCKKITTSPSINICHPDANTLQLRTEVESLRTHLRVFKAGIPSSLGVHAEQSSDVTPILSRANFLYFIEDKETRIGSDTSSHIILPGTSPSIACKIEIISNGIARCTTYSAFLRNERTVGKREHESFHLEHNDLLDFGAGATFRFTRGVTRRADVVRPIAESLRDVPGLRQEQCDRACDVFESVHHLYPSQFGDRLRKLSAYLAEKRCNSQVILVQHVFHRKPPELGVKQGNNLWTEEAFRYISDNTSESSTAPLDPLSVALCKGDFKTAQSLRDSQAGEDAQLRKRLHAQIEKIRALETLRELDIQSIERLNQEAAARAEIVALDQANHDREYAEERSNLERAREQEREHWEESQRRCALEKEELEAKLDELTRTADAYAAEYHDQRARASELEEILESRDQSIRAYINTIKDLKATNQALDADIGRLADDRSVLQERNYIRVQDKTCALQRSQSTTFYDEVKPGMKTARGRCTTPTKRATEIREFSLGAHRPEEERPVPSALAVTNQEKAERWAHRRNIAIVRSMKRGDSWGRQSSRQASIPRCDRVYRTTASTSDATGIGQSEKKTAEESSDAISLLDLRNVN